MAARTAVLRASATARRTASTSTAAFDVVDVKGAIPTAAVDEGSATAAITVVLKAGSRYEPAPGVAHMLKNFAFRSTSKRSALRIARETELYGGILTASLDREHLYLTAEFMRGDEGYFAELLGEATTLARYADHDLRESVLPQVESDRHQALASARVAAIEAAHSVAFRRGLGNSLLAPAHPHASAGSVASFAHQVVNAKGGLAVLGTGVAPATLQKLVADFFATDSVATTAAATSAGASKYFGGEIRLASETGSANGLLLGFEGGSLASPQHSVLRHILGGQSSVKWSRGQGSALSQALADASPVAEATAFNLAYTDAGLLGAYVTGGTPEEMTKLGQTFVQALDGVTVKSVTEAAKTARKSKASVVAVGDTQRLPFASELGLS